MKYYYLKITSKNHGAREWLEGKYTSGRPAAVIYFDNLTEADCRNGKGNSTVQKFIERAEPTNRHKTLMVVIHEGEVWILKPAGRVWFRRSEKYKSENGEYGRHTPKVMPVKIVRHCKTKDVPPVLAGINANRRLTQNTFEEIKDCGNLRAIDYVVRRVGQGSHWNVGDDGPSQLLQCLGSTELETLIAKLFEAHRCFVPAYRGGSMQHVDLFVHNDHPRPISIGGLNVPAKRRVSIQVKRQNELMKCPKGIDYLIGLRVGGNKKVFGADWLIKQVQACRSVRTWLGRSLNWLPKEFTEKCGLPLVGRAFR